MQTKTMAINGRNAAKKTIKILVALGALYLTSAFAQAVQILVLLDSHRSAIVTNWKVSKPEQADLVDRFVVECLPKDELVKHDGSKVTKQHVALQTIRECGESVGASELAAAIEASDAWLESGVAWPLSSLI